MRLILSRCARWRRAHAPTGWAIRVWWAIAFLACMATSTAPSLADGLSDPSGPVVLTVSGQIDHTNAPGEARFDRAMLEALGVETVVTHTAWTTGPQTFEGVPVKAVLEAVGAEGTTAHCVALNDYTVDVPLSEFSEYPALMALKMNGSYIRVRDKGPVWIVFPVDDFPELDRPEIWRHWIWQLKRMEIR